MTADINAPGSNRRRTARSLAWVVLALFATVTAGAIDVPFLSGRVVDLADLIDPATAQRIETRLAQLEDERGHQVAVLTVPSLEGDVLEDFSIRVVDTWKLGRSGTDDGALLLISRDDRVMRIEVGYGLEGTLTDLRTNRIQTEILRPRFRAGDFAGGIEAAIDAMALVLDGSDLPPPTATLPSQGLGLTERLAMFGFFLVVVGMFSLTALVSPGTGGCFFYLFLAPFWGAFPAALLNPQAGAATLGLWLVGFPIAWWIVQKTEAGKRWRERAVHREAWSSDEGWQRGRRRGGFGGFGGFGGGGFGGGSFGGGGGFSGGGGSFGGGGSSSSW